MKYTSILAVFSLSLGFFLSAGAATITLDHQDQPGGTDFQWFNTATWVGGVVPVDGDTPDLEEVNRSYTFDINNGGAGVNLPTSTLIIGRGTLYDSAGDDDSIVADVIQFNGAGGAVSTVDVPVTADTITTNRHGAVFNAVTTINTVLYGGQHQIRGEWNVSPAIPITFFELAATDGRGGTDFDDNVHINADLTALDFTQIWGGLTVGAGATFTVSGTYEKAFANPNGGAAYANASKLFLDGAMNVAVMTFDGVRQPDGTWGAIGSGADNEVDWITGAGLLTVGSGSRQLFFEVEASGADLVFTWESQAGKQYDLLSSADPEADGDPENWTEVAGHQDIVADPPTNTRTIARPVDGTRLYVLREEDIPPPEPTIVFEDDFESDKGWDTDANAGDTGTTVWQRGAPLADGVGPNSGVNGSTNCFGTNLTSVYGIDTDIYLRSPEIDLTTPGFTSATLTMAQYLDSDPSDPATIRVLRSSDFVQLGADVVSDHWGIDEDNVWNVPFFTAPLPAAALGEKVILELRFTSNDDTFNFSGWYIDDVTVLAE